MASRHVWSKRLLTLVGAGAKDIFITKQNSVGNLIWARHIGSNKDERGLGLATDSSGNVCVVGDFRYEDVKNATITCLRQVAREAHAHGVKTLGGHRDVVATACPGDHLYAQLDRIAKGSGLVRYHK